MTEQDKVTVDDIIGIVKTEEQTNSVEEVRKLRGRGNETAKRFKFNGATNCIEYDGKSILLDSYGEDIEELLNELHEENQKCKEYNGILYANHTKTDRKLVKQISELKQENEQLKLLIKKVLETTPIEHSLALDLKNSIRELYK